jgi:hypothetical protein
MLPDPILSSLATNRDVELEWLLCLATAYQVCQPHPEKFADEGRRYFQSRFLRGLQALSRGLRWTERKHAA